MALTGERTTDERNGNDRAVDRAQAERGKAVAAAIQAIEKQFGTGSIMKLGAHSITAIDVIPTGSIALDLALGVGGIPAAGSPRSSARSRRARRRSASTS